MTFTCPEKDGSVITSWYPVMHVLKTTSPLMVPSSGAPTSSPSKTAPDSSASQPRVSGMRRLRGRNRNTLCNAVNHAALAQREQRASAQAGAEQWRIAGARLQRCCVDRPLRTWVEEHRSGRLADVQTWLRNAQRGTEHTMWARRQALDERRNPLTAHASE